MKKTHIVSNLRYFARRAPSVISTFAFCCLIMAALVGTFLYVASPAHTDAIWLKDWIIPHDFSAGIYPTLSWVFMMILSLAWGGFLACFAIYRLLFVDIEQEENK